MKTQKSDQSKKFIYLLDKEIIPLRRNDETMEFGRGAVKYGEATRRYGGGRLVEDKGYFGKLFCFFLIDLFQHQLPISGDKNVLFFLYREGTFLMGDFMDCF